MWPFSKKKPAPGAPTQADIDSIDLEADDSPAEMAARVQAAPTGSGGVGDPARPWRDPSEPWSVDDVQHAAWSLAHFVAGKSERELRELWGSSMLSGIDMDDMPDDMRDDMLAYGDVDMGEQNWGPQELVALELIPDCYNLSVTFSNGVTDSLVLSFLAQPWGDTCSVMFKRGQPASLHAFTATSPETAARWAAQAKERQAEADRDDARREAKRQAARQEELHRQQMAAARNAPPREYTWVCRHCGLNVRAAARPLSTTGKCVASAHDWDKY